MEGGGINLTYMHSLYQYQFFVYIYKQRIDTDKGYAYKLGYSCLMTISR
jgi:hypothetical protein